MDPRRLREADAAGLTAFRRGAMRVRWRQVVRRRFVPVPGTLAQTPRRGVNLREYWIAHPLLEAF